MWQWTFADMAFFYGWQYGQGCTPLKHYTQAWHWRKGRRLPLSIDRVCAFRSGQWIISDSGVGFLGDQQALGRTYGWYWRVTIEQETLGTHSHQVLIGSLHPEEDHHQGSGKQLPEEQDHAEDDVCLATDLIHVRLGTTYKHTCAHAHTHTHTCMHTQTHTHTHVHRHIHRHTHKDKEERERRSVISASFCVSKYCQIKLQHSTKRS